MITTGRCPECFEVVYLRSDGTLMPHPHRSVPGDCVLQHPQETRKERRSAVMKDYRPQLSLKE
jgi:hypothetical protein